MVKVEPQSVVSFASAPIVRNLYTSTIAQFMMTKVISYRFPRTVSSSSKVQDVKAPKSAVWNQILDLQSYVGKVDRVRECENYHVKKNDDGRWNIKTKMVVSVLPGYKVHSQLSATSELL